MDNVSGFRKIAKTSSIKGDILFLKKKGKERKNQLIIYQSYEESILSEIGEESFILFLVIKSIEQRIPSTTATVFYILNSILGFLNPFTFP